MTVTETVQRFLEKHSVGYDLVPHPHTGSSHETAEAAHAREDHIAKAVIVKDTDGYAMVVVPKYRQHKPSFPPLKPSPCWRPRHRSAVDLRIDVAFT